MSGFRTIDDITVTGKRVLLRTDLNVPMDGDCITDMTRIDKALPTIKELSEKGAIIVVLSHFGRPKGSHVPSMSLKSVARVLGEAFGSPIHFHPNCVGEDAVAAVGALSAGDVIVMENVRFHGGEESNDVTFAVSLAALGDIFVNDAFSASHRAHASTEAITQLLPSVAGRLMQAELRALQDVLETPEHPVAAIVGGAKVSSKMDVLNHLMDRVDYLIIGGGMANTFLCANGVEVGASLCEKDMVDDARTVQESAKSSGCEIILPIDAVAAKELATGASSETVALNAIPNDSMILDAGPDSVAAINARLAECRTLVWNGPMGAFERTPFDMATNAIAQEAARLTMAGSLLSVAGGGDTVSALSHAGVVDRFSYISTAGGAFLEWLEGKDLPGVTALQAQY